MNRIGLLFGSFDPVHTGHLAIANDGLSKGGCESVWWVLQERNTFKDQLPQASLTQRADMLRLAIKDEPQFKLVVSRAGSMLQGLQNLTKFYHDSSFLLLMGQDLAESLPSWPDSAKIMNKYPIYSYHRKKTAAKIISSELIRTKIAAHANTQHLLPAPVERYIQKNQLYT